MVSYEFVVIFLSIAIGSSWWAYIYLAHPEIITKLSGEVGSWTSKHKNGPLYYLFRLPILLFPWVFALLGSLVLTQELDVVNFKKWAASRKLTSYEIYRFCYKNNYRIYRIKNAN